MQEEVRSSEEWQFGRLRNGNTIMTSHIDGIVRTAYRSDVGKLAAWTSASHVEKPPTKKEPPTP
ncbi:MAG: hypothetical protein JSS77_10255 [Acidobacteria bacterium]|nr:hypothetical protein [Acidobacteriota bacterium]